MQLRDFISILVFCFVCNACTTSPSRTIYKTYFINEQSSNGYEILLAKKDGLTIYATVKLSDWEVQSNISNPDSIKKTAKKNCQLTVEISTNNKGVVHIQDFDVNLLNIESMAQEDSIVFTNFCKRKEWDLQCFKSKKELRDNLNEIPYDQIVSSQLLIMQEVSSPKLFEIQKLYTKIKLDLTYNDWKVNINFSDTLYKKEIAKDYLLHP